MGQNKRNILKSFFQINLSQRRFATEILLICAFFSVAFILLFATMIHSFNLVMTGLSTDDVSSVENSVFLWWESLPTISFVVLAFLLSMFLVVIERTKRIFGPTENMKKFLSEMESGNFKARITLRKDDDFQKIAQKLNIMAENLEKRNTAS
jgi:methyl-accepting chemotaxis protein